ncbi:hypothetical protein LXL04_015383 [Taraxacum kok-saghyz]
MKVVQTSLQNFWVIQQLDVNNACLDGDLSHAIVRDDDSIARMRHDLKWKETDKINMNSLYAICKNQMRFEVHKLLSPKIVKVRTLTKLDFTEIDTTRRGLAVQMRTIIGFENG